MATDHGRRQGSPGGGSPHGARKGRGEKEMLAALMDKRLKGHEEAVYYVLRGLGMPVTNASSGELPTLEVSALKQPTLFAALKRLGIKRSPDGKSMIIKPRVEQEEEDDDTCIASRRSSLGRAAPDGAMRRSASSPGTFEPLPRDLPDDEMDDGPVAEAETPLLSASQPLRTRTKRSKDEQYIYSAKKVLPKTATERQAYHLALSREKAVRRFAPRRALTPSDAKGFMAPLQQFVATQELLEQSRLSVQRKSVQDLSESVARLSLPKSQFDTKLSMRLGLHMKDEFDTKPMPPQPKEKVNAEAQKAFCASMSLPKRVASGPSRGSSVIMRPLGASSRGVAADRDLLTRLLKQSAATAEAAVLACRGGEPLPSGTQLQGQAARSLPSLPGDDAAWAADAEARGGASLRAFGQPAAVDADEFLEEFEHQGPFPSAVDRAAAVDADESQCLFAIPSGDDPRSDADTASPPPPPAREKPMGVLGPRKGLIGWQLARGVTPWM